MSRRKSIPESPGQLSLFDMENFSCDIFGTPARTQATVTTCPGLERVNTNGPVPAIANSLDVEEGTSTADRENWRTPELTSGNCDNPYLQVTNYTPEGNYCDRGTTPSIVDCHTTKS